MNNKLTKEELNFAIYEFKYYLENAYCNGSWEEFTELTDNSKRSFENHLKIIRSIIEKLKNEKKKHLHIKKEVKKK